jgi:hypothetical protein
MNTRQLTLKTLEDIMDICRPLVNISDGSDKSPLRKVFLCASFMYNYLLINDPVHSQQSK